MRYPLAYILMFLSIPAAVVFGDMLGVLALLLALFFLIDHYGHERD
jgi:integral membrane sensor domain MASE1